MKIRNILLISYVVCIVILIFLLVLTMNKTKSENVDLYNQSNENTTNQLENTKETNIFIQNKDINTKDDSNENNCDKIINLTKKENNQVLNENIVELTNDPYYYQSNWVAEEILVSEEKQKLSFFEILDGKKASVKRKTKIVYRWLTDLNNEDSYVKNAFVLVPISTGSNIAYKYYFDKSGYIITDNLSKDWTILDRLGREIDSELKPVEYYIGNNNFSIEYVEKPYDSKENVYYVDRSKSVNSTPSQIIITEGVVFRNKLEKVFNTLIDRNMAKYIVSGGGYQTNAKGNTFKNGQWKKALKLSGNGNYIVFNNHLNNFNKVTGMISMEYILSSNKDTNFRLAVYDKENYDKGYMDEYLYYNDEFNYTDMKPISFTFDRSIKNLVFVLYVDGKNKNRSVYFKDLRFGFSKSAYRDELIRKAEDQTEIDYLKSLGLYVEDDSYFDIIDEDGEIIDEIEDDGDIENIFDSEKYYDDLIDRKSGPAFDETLKRLNENQIGPYFDNVGTKSEIKNKKIKSKIIWSE